MTAGPTARALCALVATMAELQDAGRQAFTGHLAGGLSVLADDAGRGYHVAPDDLIRVMELAAAWAIAIDTGEDPFRPRHGL